jgi:crotonobetainyl-CoA:carnitine CoA-transferase CaiB-like acyl-CoA transferase
MRVLQEAGVPATASFTASDLFSDAHLRERGVFTSIALAGGGARVLPGLPWRVVDGPGPRHTQAPGIGEHTDSVLREVLDMKEAEVAGLRSSGALT